MKNNKVCLGENSPMSSWRTHYYYYYQEEEDGRKNQRIEISIPHPDRAESGPRRLLNLCTIFFSTDNVDIKWCKKRFGKKTCQSLYRLRLARHLERIFHELPNQEIFAQLIEDLNRYESYEDLKRKCVKVLGVVSHEKILEVVKVLGIEV